MHKSRNEVMSDEPLARFLFQRSHFSGMSRVKYGAFLPSKQGQTSVHRVFDLTHGEICGIGKEGVLARMEDQTKILYGWAEVSVAHVEATGLEINPDDTPPRHANIIGWPAEKHEKKQIAIDLAAEATLNLCS